MHGGHTGATHSHVHLDSILTFNDKLENQEHRCLTLLYTERNKSH